MSIYFLLWSAFIRPYDSSLMMVTFQPFIQYQNSMETMRTFYYFLLWLKWEGPILCLLMTKICYNPLQIGFYTHGIDDKERCYSLRISKPDDQLCVPKKSHRWDWIYFSFGPQIIEQWKLAAFWHSVTIWAVGKKMSAVIHRTTLNSHQFQSQPKTGHYQAKVVKNIQKTSNMDPSFCL